MIKLSLNVQTQLGLAQSVGSFGQQLLFPNSLQDRKCTVARYGPLKEHMEAVTFIAERNIAFLTFKCSR